MIRALRVRHRVAFLLLAVLLPLLLYAALSRRPAPSIVDALSPEGLEEAP
jgi:hypothetical protein